MATSKHNVSVEMKVVDKITPQLKRTTQALDSFSEEATRKSKQTAKQQSEYVRKFNSDLKNLAFGAVGVIAIRKGFQELGKAVVEAGLNTEKTNESLGQIYATVGKQILPEVQLVFDTISQNAGLISDVLSNTLAGLMAPFRLATSFFLRVGGWIALATKNVELAKALKEEANLTAQSAFSGFGHQELQTPKSVLDAQKKAAEDAEKRRQEEALKASEDAAKRRQEEARKAAEDIAAKNLQIIKSRNERIQKEEEDAVAKRLEIERLYISESTAAITDQYERQKVVVMQAYAEKIELAKGNDVLLKILADNQSRELIDIDKEREETRTQMFKEESEKRIAQQELERKSAIRATTEITTQTVRTLDTIAQATKLHGDQLKAWKIAEAWISAGSASMGAWSSSFESIPNPYAALATAGVMQGLIIAEAVAQTALISQQKFALGGKARPGFALVGEHGPELVEFGSSATIHDAARTRQILNTTNNNNQRNLTVNMYNSTGDMVASLRADVRSGRADRLLTEINDRLARR